MKELKNSDRLPEGLFVRHGGLLYTLNPNTQVLATTSDFSVIYRINSRGLRDKEYDFAKPKDKIRILAVGDSLTFGEGIEYGDRFTDIVERSFPNLEVINFGVPGYGLDQMFVKFAKEGLNYSPDYVIIFFGEAIIDRFAVDISNNKRFVSENILPGIPGSNTSTVYVKRSGVFFDKKRAIWALDRSFLLSFINYKLSLLSLKQKLRENDKRVWDAIGTEWGKAPNPGIERSISIIKRFNDFCKEHGITLIIINIDNCFTDLNSLRSAGNNILYYDLGDDLRKEARKHRLFFIYDSHYNKKTHSFIGQKVTEILRLYFKQDPIL